MISSLISFVQYLDAVPGWSSCNPFPPKWRGGIIGEREKIVKNGGKEEMKNFEQVWPQLPLATIMNTYCSEQPALYKYIDSDF